MEASKAPPWKTHTDFLIVGPPLGSGSFGTVWKVKHEILRNHNFAIKQVFIDTTLREYNGKADRLLQEVENLININHLNVVRYFYFWLEGPNVSSLPEHYVLPLVDESLSSSQEPTPEENFLFIQMELCDETLKDWMVNNATVKTVEGRNNEFRNIFLQVTCGLKAIHEKRITHRDLKLDNIFRLGTTWKIGDFGLSRREIQEDLPQQQPQEGNPHAQGMHSKAGAELYRSPDTFCTMKSDVYTLGLIFLEVLIPDFNKYQFRLDRRNGRNPLNEHKGFISDNYLREYEIVCEMLNPNAELRPESATVYEKLSTITEELNSAGSKASKSLKHLIELSNSKSIPNKDNVKKPLWFEVRKPTFNFVGRKYHLGQLTNAFKQQRFIVVISGLGGVGKTELVKNFASDFYLTEHGNCLWLEGGSEDKVIQSVERLATQMQIDTYNLNTSSVLQRIYQNLQSPTLLIFDNVDNENQEMENLIRSFQTLPPGTDPPFILITTRSREIISITGGDSIELNVLEDQEAIELITKSVSYVTQNDAKLLCQTLQNYPLALQQAICYINFRMNVRGARKIFQVSDYLDRFEVEKKKILDYKLTIAGHDYSLTTLTTWNMSFESIKSDEELGSIATGVLDMWAYLLNADGEQLQFFIELFQIYEICKANPDSDSSIDIIDLAVKQFRCPISIARPSPTDGTLLGNYKLAPKSSLCPLPKRSTTEEELELIDDDRPVARAIQLINLHSICNVELRYADKKDSQFLSMHRLVHEVIKISKLKEQELELVQNFGKFLMHSHFRSWDCASYMYMDCSSSIKIRLQMIKKLWPVVCKYDNLVSELKDIFSTIWRDSKPGFLPYYKYLETSVLDEFLSTVYESLVKLGCISDFSLLIIEYYRIYLQTTIVHDETTDPGKMKLKQVNDQKMLEMYPISCGDEKPSSNSSSSANGKGKTIFPLLSLYELYQKVKVQLSPYHFLRLETLDILSYYIYRLGMSAQLGGGDKKLDVCNANQIFLDVIEISWTFQLSVKARNSHLLKTLCILSNILDAYAKLHCFNDILILGQNILKVFETHGVERSRQCVYIFTYFSYFVSKSLRLVDEGDNFLKQVLTQLYFNYDELVTMSLKQAHTLVSKGDGILLQASSQLSAKLLNDEVNYLVTNPDNSFYFASPITQLFQTLVDNNEFELIEELTIQTLSTSAILCEKKMYQQVLVLLHAVEKIELCLWEANLYHICLEIGKRLPQFCCYQKDFNDNRVGKWIDGIIERIQKLEETGTFDLHNVVKSLKTSSVVGPVALPPQNHQIISSSERESQVLEIVQSIENSGPEAVQEKVLQIFDTSQTSLVNVFHCSTNILSTAEYFWDDGRFEQWQQVFETTLSQINNHNFFVHYMIPKIAFAVETVLNKSDVSTLYSVPIETLIWVYSFAVENHIYIKGTHCYKIIETIVDRLVELSNEIVLLEVGYTILEVCSESNNEHKTLHEDDEIYNYQFKLNRKDFWYCMYSIGAISKGLRRLGKLEEELKLCRKVLCLPEDATKFLILRRELQNMTYFVIDNRQEDTNCYPVVIFTVEKWLDQLIDYNDFPQGIAYYPIDVFEFLRNLIGCFKSYGCFEEIYILLETLYKSKDTSPHHADVAKKVSVQAVVREFFTFKHRDVVFLFETGLLKSSISLEIKSMLETEVNLMIDLIISLQNGKELLHYPVVPFLNFMLKYGDIAQFSKCETILNNLLNYYLDRDKIEEMYNLGLKFSNVPKRMLKTGAFYVKFEELVISYFKLAYEKDMEKFKRVVVTLGRGLISTWNNRASFIAKVDQLLDEIGVELNKDIIVLDEDEGEGYCEMDGDDDGKITAIAAKSKELELD